MKKGFFMLNKLKIYIVMVVIGIFTITSTNLASFEFSKAANQSEESDQYNPPKTTKEKKAQKRHKKKSMSKRSQRL